LEGEEMSSQELRIIRFANFVDAGNAHAVEEVLKEQLSEGEEIMMKAILIKASLRNLLSPAMQELADNFVS
jgi:hypothetical protein